MIREHSNEGAAEPEGAAAGPKEFRFQCTLCGDCCTGNQVVRLTRTDLDRLAAKVGLDSAGALRGAGLVSWVREPLGDGRSVWRPRIRFRTRPLRQCPFLVNDVADDGTYRGLCSLHPDFKPLVCRLSPLAREVSDHGGAYDEVWSFVPPVEGCPGVGQGDELPVGAPADRRADLEAEVRWLRFLTARSPSVPDEAAAWSLLEKEAP